MDVFRLMLVSLAGWGNQQQEPMIDHLQEEIRASEGSVECRERLGGLLRYYYRDAA
jgi:hypothetical protein